ncbi:MAG: hypothetical protein AAB659_00025 [Patescibacteria group bacterium]
MVIQSWADVLVSSFQDVWTRFAMFIPSFVLAVIVFIIGLILAAGLGALVERVVSMLKVDKALAKAGVEEYVERAGLKLNTGVVLGQVVYWFVIIVFLLAVSDMLGFMALSSFLAAVLLYIPNVVVGVLIMLVTVVVANFLKKTVKASVMSARLHAAGFLGTLTWWAIVIFGLATALGQIGLDVTILNTVITGIIAMFAIAGGIAFGLGGKDAAARLIERFQEQVGHR